MKKNKLYLEVNEKNLLSVFKEAKRPLGMHHFNEFFAINTKQRKALKRLLKDLIKKGLLLKLKNNMFGISDEMDLVTGTLWCTKSGNGFVIPNKEKMKDIFIPGQFMKKAFHGDQVIARVEKTFRGRKEGKIIRIIKRNTHNIIGFIKLYNNKLYITPEDTRYNYNFNVVNAPKKLKVIDGDLVAAKITRFPDAQEQPECDIVKHFENGLNDVKAITNFIEYKHNLPARFKKLTELETKNLSPDTTQEKRADLRKLKHVTIDGELAKDFDDAVCIEKTKQGYTLFVSIADVSSYVAIDSHLDREACERGTSIYFPGKVLPMLPKALSNGLCSINPSEDKLAITAKIQYDSKGNVIKSTFEKSIIKSIKRLTYRQVEEVLVRGNKEIKKELKMLMPDLEHMAELALLLKGNRENRGSLDFDLPEPEVVLDSKGGIKEIIRSQRFFSHQIIEEFMVSANEAVARFLRDNNLPAIYRIHEPPEREKLRDIETLVCTLPIGHKKTSTNDHLLQSILQRARGTDYEFFVNRVLLRSMKQARYSAFNKGHFGLASDCYLHFTSPIRRYPDLVCHRSLKSLGNNVRLYSDEDLESVAAHLSERERVAMDAERELEDRIKILFMKDKIGEVYQGIISHITAFGFFVELSDIFIEGLILLADLTNDYYHFEEEKFRLIGKRTRKIYRIGDKVTIKVVVADVATKRLHFMPA
ncbi:MAG: ribonuclease R [Syntrophus sp. (in: bacteria)]|nr:ribonuclease R [Syntrophus sp. (in: bacteria)]